MDLASLQKSIADQGKFPPVDKWNPDFCGDIDLKIKQDGTWHYMGTPIGRIALVKLFASVIKKEESEPKATGQKNTDTKLEKYFLVTPVEKVGIVVEDAPFIATQWRLENNFIILTTSVGDEVVVSQENPVVLKFNSQQQDKLPYVLVRRNLWARLHQNVFYQLVDIGTEGTSNDNCKVLQLKSGDYSFTLGAME